MGGGSRILLESGRGMRGGRHRLRGRQNYGVEGRGAPLFEDERCIIEKLELELEFWTRDCIIGIYSCGERNGLIQLYPRMFDYVSIP